MDGFLILAIETATTCGSVSITSGRGQTFQVLAESITQPDITHSRRLLGGVGQVMLTAGVGWDDLDGIAVSLGPGSFTGLRIGMAAAKAVCMATGLPLVGAPTLTALAMGGGTGSSHLVCSMLDARKQEVYAAFFRLDEAGFPEPLGPPAVLSPADLLDSIAEPVMLIGPGSQVYREMFAKSELVTFLPDHFSLPRAMHVGLLGAELLAAGQVLDPLTAVPLYVRASEAEINLKRKKQQL